MVKLTIPCDRAVIVNHGKINCIANSMFKSLSTMIKPWSTMISWPLRQKETSQLTSIQDNFTFPFSWKHWLLTVSRLWTIISDSIIRIISNIITTGVPRGSILGPLLFIPYVNDISICCNHPLVNLYTDETLFYFANSNIDLVSRALNHDLQGVWTWLRANKLSLHIGKPVVRLSARSPKHKIRTWI